MDFMAPENGAIRWKDGLGSIGDERVECFVLRKIFHDPLEIWIS